MRKVRYVLPYFYDEADEAWPIKYVNDLQAAITDAGKIRLRDDGTPIDCEFEIEATDDVHQFLASRDDVTVLVDPA